MGESELIFQAESFSCSSFLKVSCVINPNVLYFDRIASQNIKLNDSQIGLPAIKSPFWSLSRTGS